MSQTKILFIDDTPSNLHIAEAYLEDIDSAVYLADSGLKGLQMAKSEKPDVIFLDLEMPELDGFETAKAIRAFSTTPIIAMTGHNEADIKTKLSRGAFNGYMGKPFTVETVIALITKFTGIAPQPLTSTPSSDTTAASLPAIDQHQSVLDLADVNVRLKNNTKLINKILQSFAQNNTHTFKALCSALDQEEWSTAKRICHTLKGGGANIGATRLSALGGELEKICAQKILPTKSQLNEINQQISLAIAACKQQLEVNSEPNTSSDSNNAAATASHIKQKLSGILSNLESDVGLAQDELDQLDAEVKNNDDIKQMVDLFNQFELTKLANRIENYLNSYQ